MLGAMPGRGQIQLSLAGMNEANMTLLSCTWHYHSPHFRASISELLPAQGFALGSSQLGRRTGHLRRFVQLLSPCLTTPLPCSSVWYFSGCSTVGFAWRKTHERATSR